MHRTINASVKDRVVQCPYEDALPPNLVKRDARGRIALRLDPKIKLLPCVAPNKETVKNVLLELLYSILSEMETNDA